MERLFPLSRMVAGGRAFGEEGNVPPSTSSMITGMEMLPHFSARTEAEVFFPSCLQQHRQDKSTKIRSRD